MYDENYFEQFDWIVPENFKSIVQPHIIYQDVLDIGCGNGTLGQEIDKWCNIYLGIDISKYALQEMKKKNLDCIIVDKSLPFNLKNSFHIACLFDVLEHLRDTQIAVLLKSVPDTLIFSTPLQETPDPTHINVKREEDWRYFFWGFEYYLETIGEFTYPEPDGSESVSTVFYAKKKNR